MPCCAVLWLLQVIETAVLIMADRATAKGLETVIEMAPDTPLFIVSDANHCMEVSNPG